MRWSAQGGPELNEIAPPVGSTESTRAFTIHPTLSIVIPTLDEAGNVASLASRLASALSGTPTELVFVDDSSDGTPSAIRALPSTAHFEPVLLHREPAARWGGLGGAVVDGLRAARGDWVCVMDADLQHPPELVPALLNRARESGLDLVVASRYCQDGATTGFAWWRSLVSMASTTAARMLFPRKLRGVTDPMSGFFLCRRNAIDIAALHPNGFKVLLEILARSPELRIGELPFVFGERNQGESKASAREGLRYLHHLVDLRAGPETYRFLKFGLVGASGLLVNSLFLAFNVQELGFFYLLAAVLATQGSTLWNFLLSEWLVFSRTSGAGRVSRRAGLFFAMNNAAFLVRGPMLFVLTSFLGVHYLISNLISMVALLFMRFTLADRWIWRTGPAPAPNPISGVAIPATTPAREGV